MKITYLLTWGDAMGGTEAAAFSQAAALADRHEVEILSVLRTEDTPFFALDPRVPMRYLIDARRPVQQPVRTAGLEPEVCEALSRAPSELVPAGWESAFNQLSDIELRYALPRLRTDVLVSTTPALMSLITRLAPPDAVTVGQEHRISELRGPSAGPLLSCAPQLDALIVPTEPTRSWFAESLGDAAPHLEAIPNAVPAGFQPRSSLDGRTILVACRLVPEKQVDHAIVAFSRLSAVHPGWTLRICGDGPDMTRLRALADAQELHNRVEFLGTVPTMSEEWAKASVCLLPSHTEAFGRVLTEAFAAGVPAVSYDCPTGPAEVIRHGVDGLLAPADDVDGLAVALDKLMGDDELRHEMGQAALQGLTRFSVEDITARWEGLYTDLVEYPPADRARSRAERAARHAAATARRGMVFRSLPWEQTRSQVPNMSSEEARLLRLHPDLVRSGGRLAGVRDDLMPVDALRANLDLIVDALDAAGVPYALLRDEGPRHRVMVTADVREAALAALAEAHADAPVYVHPLKPRGGLPQSVLASMAAGLADISGVRVHRPWITPGRTLRYGADYAADLEFWTWDEDLTGYVGPQQTDIGDRIPLEAMRPGVLCVRNREYATYEPFTRHLVHDVQFPIDAVFTWVDGGDPKWRKRLESALEESGRSASESVDAAEEYRFTNSDELRYALRSIAMFAPWIRRIHLVTDDQVPAWLNTAHPRIVVVSHRQLFGGRGALPTFNSHAIETQLHHIEGLSEQFLYFNDDFFLGRPLRPGKFFHPDGTAMFFPSPTTIPFGAPSPDEPAYLAAAKRNRALLERTFDRSLTHGFRHAPYALRRSVLAEIDERFPDEVAATAASRLRAHTDIAIPSSLHHHYAYLTGRAVPGTLSYAHVDVGDREQHLLLTQLLTARSHDAFCVTDSAPHTVPRPEQTRMIRAFLRGYFPLAAPWERPDTPDADAR
ncbi:glycosyltransferase involved in cell wall biosynthesis [Nocardiopsis mwathae]|uniref:Glycosyltransferase involved in cell wall biosynthesis n=1 Tax=Nocardiopsis mwathae TaxID=1472723 RepID=A0A7W9YF86_9ACTN|nr:stealth conserved region 3 domain-containing protein [Nocardiopsis mwathae]MBB6170171.1 glycosyltransferase involved in cell wall biosynthesis [Nocardiopsis mwathae]